MSNPFIVKYTGNGSQTDFQVPATYIRQAHVSVSVGGVLTSAYIWHTSSIIRLNVAPGNGVEVVIIDQAPGDPLNVYSGSTGLSALSLNENFKQSVQLAAFAFNAAKDIVEGNIPASTITGDMLVNGAVTAAKTSAGVQASLSKADSSVPPTGTGATGTWNITATGATDAARVSPTSNSVGTYNNLFNNSGVAISPGIIVDGAGLLPATGNASGVWVSGGSARTGTWRCMSGNQILVGGFGLFQRVT